MFTLLGKTTMVQILKPMLAFKMEFQKIWVCSNNLQYLLEPLFSEEGWYCPINKKRNSFKRRDMLQTVFIYLYLSNSSIRRKYQLKHLVWHILFYSCCHRSYFFLFSGITGYVNIDSNGDRIADYSLLDMDPNTAEFEVCHY